MTERNGRKVDNSDLTGARFCLKVAGNGLRATSREALVPSQSANALHGNVPVTVAGFAARVHRPGNLAVDSFVVLTARVV